MTPSGQALLGPHQSLVGDSCGQKNKNKKTVHGLTCSFRSLALENLAESSRMRVRTRGRLGPLPPGSLTV